MSAVFVLLPLALLFAGISLAWFVWAVRSGQYDDLETPAVRILFDDDELPPKPVGEPARVLGRAPSPPGPGGPSSRASWRRGTPRTDGKVHIP